MPAPTRAYDAYERSGLHAYEPATAGGEVAQYALNYIGLLPPARDAAILDIGCGAGGFLGWLREQAYTNGRGVDLSNAAIEECRRRGIGNAKKIDDLAGYLRDHQKTFAFVAMNDVIEHFPRAELLRVLELVRGALLPGGTLVVKTLNMANPGARYLRYADFTHELGFTETSVRQALFAAGFDSVDVRPYRVPVRSAAGRVWLAAGRVWERVVSGALLLDVGTERPAVVAKLLLAVARSPGRSG